MLQKLIQNYSYTYWDAQDVYRKSVTLTYLARSLGHITFYDVTTLTIRGVLTHNQHLYVLYQACCAFEMSWGSQGGGGRSATGEYTSEKIIDKHHRKREADMFAADWLYMSTQDGSLEQGDGVHVLSLMVILMLPLS